MKRVSLYSSSGRSRGSGHTAPAADSSPTAVHHADSRSAEDASAPDGRVRAFYRRHERAALIAGGALLVLLVGGIYGAFTPAAPHLTQRDIDRAVLHTLEGLPPEPSLESVAFATIRPSVVRVRRLEADEDGEVRETDAGTGVVIVDDGTILTNLHVVAGAKRVNVVFADGTESDAVVTGAEPQHDLAVIKPKTIPDDLSPATLRSTSDLRLGDEVVAVGFPFGIGPSVSSGVVSGLRREYRSPEGKRLLTNLIQFDAAANPGSSGGPLITMDGEVVGIVTAILNPNEQAVFIGIGFAVPIENAAAAVGLSPF
jgi:S1-C subfamily serine protease